jgi:hypothetical protein
MEAEPRGLNAQYSALGAHQVPGGDMAVALRLVRCCARSPVALERLDYDARAREALPL